MKNDDNSIDNLAKRDIIGESVGDSNPVGSRYMKNMRFEAIPGGHIFLTRSGGQFIKLNDITKTSLKGPFNAVDKEGRLACFMQWEELSVVGPFYKEKNSGK